MTNPSHDEELDKYSYQYDPERALQPQGKRGWLLLGALICIALGVAATLGVNRLLNVPAPPPSALASMPQPDLMIAGTVNEMALLLVDTNGPSSQIKVITTTSSTLNVQDLTYGRFQTVAAALAPQKDHLVYLREERGHRTAVVIDLDSSSSTTLEKEKLEAVAGGDKIEPCSWSPVVWSPNDTRFCFFGCDKTTSVLVVVEAATELTPIVIKKTESAQRPPRQVFWLDDENLLYTDFDVSTEQTWVRRIKAHSDGVPLDVYGR